MAGRDLDLAVRRAAWTAPLPDGGTVPALDLARGNDLAGEMDVPVRDVELCALRQGIMPARYLRNLKAYSPADQLRLAESSLGMVGLGGLGGHLLEHFLRMGVGSVACADMDVFEAHNLNRQLLSSLPTLGSAKADAALERVRTVNPAVSVQATRKRLDADGMTELLWGRHLAVDALGGLQCRQDLQEAAGRARVPLVTGAMAGNTGYVAVVAPGRAGPSDFLGQAGAAEDELGTQSPCVAAVAALMAQEALALLLGGEGTLTGRMLIMDLGAMQFETVLVDKE
jgi:molybdopterin/thiamine biosynthesis adenylyltransferase